MYITIPIMLSVIVLAGCANATKAPASNSESGSLSEAYAVYSALISKQYIKDQVELIVIKDKTGLGRYAEPDEQLNYVKQRMPNLTQEVISDFQTKNRQPQALTAHFNLKVKYELVNEEEMNKLFQKDSSWSEFYRRYPKSQGIMALSNVGFNESMNQALVYVGNQAGPKSGAGHYVLLVKKNGIWIIQQEVETWVS